MNMNVKIEEYEPGLFDRLVSRGAKFEPNLTGTHKIKLFEDLEDEGRERAIRHEKAHLSLFPYYVPAWLVLMFLLSFLSFSYFVWCFFLGWLFWEGYAVLKEKEWI